MPGSVPSLFGVETEFAVAAIGAAGQVLPLDVIVSRFVARAAARPHVPGSEPGIFLANGGRLYVDRGYHPEYASPETTNPWEAVRYSFAGDTLMAQLAGEVAGEDPRIASLSVRKGNVDYVTGASWASHENYLHRCPPAAVRQALIPHLVSRIVLSGSGGYDPFSTTPRFVLSPRVKFIARVIDSSVPGEIALVDERDQPHCTGFYRQHIMCGDANQSQLAMLLRIGTTALIVALAEAGCARDEDVRLAEPLPVLAAIAADVTLRRSVALASGRRLTAVDIQRHYLGQAWMHLDRLPVWAAEVCRLWQETLDRLDRGPEAVADRLDWAIRLAVHRDRVDRMVGSAEADVALRAELCEIDVRFGQVYPPGLFHALDEAGVLRHRVAGIDPIDPALSSPPSSGRASIRGRVVARLADATVGALCGWDSVRDLLALKWLDLSDPFCAIETWCDLPAGETTADRQLARLAHFLGCPASPATLNAIRDIAARFGAWGERDLRRSAGHAIALNNHACELRAAGRTEESEWLMRAALATDLAVRPANHPKLPHRRNNLAVVLLMQGSLPEARYQTTLAWAESAGRCDVTSARILTTRLIIALMSAEPCDLYLGQLKVHLARRPLPNAADVDLIWKLIPALDGLAPRLPPADIPLLKTIVRAFNGEQTPDALESMPRWRDAPWLPLAAPWPGATGADPAPQFLTANER